MSCNLIDLDSSKYLQGLVDMQGHKYRSNTYDHHHKRNIKDWSKAHALHVYKWSFYSKFEASMMFNSPLKRQNTFSSSGLVNISANCLSVRTCLRSLITVSFSNMISNEMMTNFNILSSRMLHGIVSNLNSTLIIT